MTQDDVQNAYFEWLYEIVCGSRFGGEISFRKLIIHLHNTEFRYIHPNDKARAREGENLRYRFAVTQMHSVPEHAILDILAGPCSVLEMMVALAIYAEEHVMADPQLGDRTGQWFWKMVSSLGLGGETDKRYDRRNVDTILTRFMERKYEPNGQGGLFTIRNCNRDLRKVEIFHQLCWFLDTLT